MRSRFVEMLAAATSFVAASCQFPTMEAPSCDDDAALCPESSPKATSVTCDCRCTIGSSVGSGNAYQGRVAVCLPAALNARTASAEQRLALDALEPRIFDQRVYGYCSQTVAGFVRAAIKGHAGLKLAACTMPVRCDCTTTGTTRDSAVCHEPCAEIPCDDHKCPTILRRDAKLEIPACSCSRASACGLSSPPEEQPGLCRDWLTLRSNTFEQ